MTVKTLNSGLVVGNFSSPHDFTFDTGEVLHKVSTPDMERRSLKKTSEEHDSSCGKFKVSSVSFELTDTVKSDLVHFAKLVDVLIIPFPMLKALERHNDRVTITLNNDMNLSNMELDVDVVRASVKCHTCFITDRATKVVSSSKFCK